jgi:uncharacterized protein DUF3226
MSNFAIIVEGAHDASFLGRLLKARGFAFANKLSLVPVDWKILFPKTFPMDGETLDRVMRFPEIFTQDDLTIGITTSGSDSRLISTLRFVIDAMGLASLSGIAVFIDTDKHDTISRFAAIQKQITAMNNAALEEGQPGYPIAVPQIAGVMETGAPPVGVFLFPDNSKPGALEDILLECARINHPDIATRATALVTDLDKKYPAGHADLKALRTGVGKGKAMVGTIANVLRPGASVAVSLAQTNWMARPAFEHALVSGVDAFLGALLDGASTRG